jgi:hypothetical protein
MRVIGNAFLDAETPCGAPNSTFSHNAFVSRPCGSNSITHPLSVYQAGMSNLFGLLASSVLRNKGNPNSFPSVDRAGKSRPAGGAPDIGAYEFG